MRKVILFLTSRPDTARDLSGGLSAMEPDWEMICHTSDSMALSRLSQGDVDAVVAEIDLAAFDGPEFLTKAAQQNPSTPRFVLSDLTNRSAVTRCIGRAHHFLLKPCDALSLHSILRRAFSMEIWLPNETVSRLLMAMNKLPSPPALYFQVVKELASPTASLEEVGKLIARDPAMTAKILQFVNSASFGLRRQVDSVPEAVFFLGISTTRSLILLAHSYSYFSAMTNLGFSIDQLWEHSFRVGRYAREIVRLEQLDNLTAESAFTAGMLHDIGKLALAANYSSNYQKVIQLQRAKGIAVWEAEQEVFRASHAEVGGCLMAVWGLPVMIVEAICQHHHPTRMASSGFCPLTAVHAANAIDHALQEKLAVIPADQNYLAELNLDSRLEEWSQTCAELTNAENE